MVPIRDVVVFPFQMVAFVIGRESSVQALEAALLGDKRIFLATQHDPIVDNPKPNDIYQVLPEGATTGPFPNDGLFRILGEGRHVQL